VVVRLTKMHDHYDASPISLSVFVTSPVEFSRILTI
jgi:hypothetical protein